MFEMLYALDATIYIAIRIKVHQHPTDIKNKKLSTDAPFKMKFFHVSSALFTATLFLDRISLSACYGKPINNEGPEDSDRSIRALKSPSMRGHTKADINNSLEVICKFLGIKDITKCRDSTRIQGIIKNYGAMPTEIGLLTKLTDIDIYVASNKIPSTIGLLTNLRRLKVACLQDNVKSTTIPKSIGELTNLNELSFTRCQYANPIPSEIRQLKKLNAVYLDQNQFQGRFPDFGGLTSLTTLSIAGNNFNGTLPTSLSRFPKLRGLQIQDNLFSGEVSVVAKLTKLHTFDASGNLLVGSIPNSFGSLSALSQLDLARNKLVGTIPSAIGKLILLNKIDLSLNALTGSIPLSIGNLNALEDMNLSKNKLMGTIPSLIGNLPLLNIDLSGNSLKGTIPNSFGNLKNMTLLDVSNNLLIGTIPSAIGKLSYLFSAFFHSNQFTGTVSDTFCEIRSYDDFFTHPSVHLDCQEVICKCCTNDVGKACK
jgi:Leucine-rich repeat (LRR) protein